MARKSTYEELERRVREFEQESVERKRTEEQLTQALKDAGLEREKLRTAVNSAPFGMVLIGKDGTFTYMNPKFKELFGYDEADVPNGKEWFRKAFPDAEYRHGVIATWIVDQESAEPGERRPRVFQVTCKDGSNKTASIATVLLENGENLVSFEDISERKRAEEALQESEERFRSVFNYASDGIVLTDLETQMLDSANINMCQMLGYSQEELKKLKITDIHPKEKLPFILEQMDRQLKNPLAPAKDLPMIRKDGTLFYANVRGARIVLSRREYLLGIFRDVTERMQMEEALRESEQRYRVLFEGSTHGILAADIETRRFVFANPSICRMLGYSDVELQQLGMADIHPKDSLDHVRSEFESQIRGKKTLASALPCLRKDGTVFYADIAGASTIIHGRRCYVGFFADVTDRRRALEVLRESEEKYREILQSIEDGYFEVDLAGNFSFFNDALCRILGYSLQEMMGMNNRQYMTPETSKKVFETFNEVYRTGRATRGLGWDLVSKDGQIRCVETSVSPLYGPIGDKIGFRGIARDVTEQNRAEEERRRLEAQLQQARKTESLGRMAGAIAHHYNNLMGAVMGNLELALEGLPSGSRLQENIDEAMKASRRAAEISHLMLAYLGQGLGKREPMDLSEFCREALPLLTASLPHKTRLKTEFPAQAAVVRADAAQMKQVLTNLVVNAGEAIGDGEGDITVTINVIPAADIHAPRFYPSGWEPRAETYVCLSVTDTGGGMDPETMEKLFDPFFSTKFTGRGLGLPVVMGIVKAHEGMVTVEIMPGQGATFRVFLPVTAEKLLQPWKAEPVEAGAVEEGGLVLVVDDQPMVRNMAQRMLKHIGYEVIMAADGVEAVEVFQQHQGQIRCVLLDLTMPRMDGWETLEALRGIQPDLAVILSSGYDEAQVMAGEHPERPQVFLKKPYESADLKAALAAAQRGPVRA